MKINRGLQEEMSSYYSEVSKYAEDKGTHFKVSNIRLYKVPKSRRLQCSNLAAALNMNPYESRSELISYALGVKKKLFTLEQQKRMIHGSKTEDKARRWYEIKHNIKIESAYLAVPKSNVRFIAMADGLLPDGGLLEIKCPMTMYPLDKEHTCKVINMIHYIQIQGEMYAYGAPYCVYLVFVNEETTYEEYIYRDEQFISEMIEIGLYNHFIDIDKEHVAYSL